MSVPFSRFDVCLVGTSNPENLGATARVMDNFGFDSLRLVAPWVERTDNRAMVVARTARTRLEEAKVFDTLAEAIADATYVVGLTARTGDRRETVSLRAGVARLATFPAHERVAIVFGPEESGLSGDDADACDLLCTIPTRGPLSSLNLAQAVSLTLWELSQADATPSSVEHVRGGATRADVDGLIEHAFLALDAFSYFHDKDRERKRTDLRRILSSAGLSAEQVQGLRGLCRQALWALANGAKPVSK